LPQPTGNTIPISRSWPSELAAKLTSSAYASRCGVRMRSFCAIFGSRVWKGLLCIVF
jgi:hypothetical protein